MEKNKTFTTRKIVFAALMAALTCVGSALRIGIPIDIGGNTYFHLGNIFCALSGILLGPWLGGLASGLGSAIYDMFYPAFISECWLTFLMKGAYAVAVGMTFRHLHVGEYLRDLISTTAGALTYAVLYLGKKYLETMIVSGVTAGGAMVAVVSRLPATTFNMAVAIIIAPILSTAIRKALKQSHISLN